jgi:hypothetical protein
MKKETCIMADDLQPEFGAVRQRRNKGATRVNRIVVLMSTSEKRLFQQLASDANLSDSSWALIVLRRERERHEEEKKKQQAA